MAAEDIQSTDRNDADIDIAALELSGRKFPLNVLAKPDGTALEPASQATLEAARVLLESLATAISQHDAVATDGHGGLVLLAKRRDSDAAAMVADGDFGYLSLDENQRLKVASQPASYVDITGDITAVQATIGTPAPQLAAAGGGSSSHSPRRMAPGAPLTTKLVERRQRQRRRNAAFVLTHS